jgi:mannose-6-phosphate isomerase-like protein (cupin superfamily)
MTELTRAFALEPGGNRRPGAMLPFKLTADDSGGRLSVCEFTLDGWESGPVLHMHAGVDEAFFVVSGRLEAQLGEGRVQVDAGAFLWVPRGTAHSFANAGPELVHVVGMATPGGIEHLFAEQDAYFSNLQGPPDPVVLDEMGVRHGSPTLGPPIRATGAPAADG